MDDTWTLFGHFVLATVVATAIGVLIYLRVNSEPWPMTTRIGTGLGGAAAGTFAGGLLALAYSLEGWLAGLVTMVIASAFAVGMQRLIYSGQRNDPLDPLQ